MDRANPRTHLPDGMTPKQRSAQKIALGLTWVCGCRYTTATRMALASGTTNRRFVTSLINKGYLRKVDTGSDPKTVIMLTKAGRQKAAEYTPHWQTYSLKARVGVTFLRHHLRTQDVMLKHMDEQTTYTPERLIESLGLEDEKRPDALLHRAGRTAAIEVELSYKSDQRIYRALRAYVRAFRKFPDYYGQVAYYFDDPAMRDHYQQLFNKEAWPGYEQTPDKKKWVPTGKAFYPDDYEGIRERYRFLMIDDDSPSFLAPTHIKKRLKKRSGPTPPTLGTWYRYGRSLCPNLVTAYDDVRQIVSFINTYDTRTHTMKLWQWAHHAIPAPVPTIPPRRQKPYRTPLSRV